MFPSNQTNMINRKHTLTDTHTQRYLSLEVMLVLEDGVEVSVHADSIREHLLLVVEEGIGAEIIREIHALVHRGSVSVPAHDAVLVAPHVAHCHCLESSEREKETVTRV